MCKIYTRKVDSSSIIQFKKCRYSVPSIYRGDEFTVEDCKTLRIYNNYFCREYQRKVTTIIPEDYIDDESKVDAEVEGILLISALIGRNTCCLIKLLVRSKKHPYLSFRTIEAIFYLADKYGCKTVELACEYALEVEKPYYYFIKKLLKGDGIYSF